MTFWLIAGDFVELVVDHCEFELHHLEPNFEVAEQPHNYSTDNASGRRLKLNQYATAIPTKGAKVAAQSRTPRLRLWPRKSSARGDKSFRVPNIVHRSNSLKVPVNRCTEGLSHNRRARSVDCQPEGGSARAALGPHINA